LKLCEKLNDLYEKVRKELGYSKSKNLYKELCEKSKDILEKVKKIKDILEKIMKKVGNHKI